MIIISNFSIEHYHLQNSCYITVRTHQYCNPEHLVAFTILEHNILCFRIIVRQCTRRCITKVNDTFRRHVCALANGPLLFQLINGLMMSRSRHSIRPSHCNEGLRTPVYRRHVRGINTPQRTNFK